MNDTHIHCTLYGVRYRLAITGYDFSHSPVMHQVEATDLLKMMPRIMVGAAYDTYTPYKVLKAGRADFKIRKIERLKISLWRYVFEDHAGRMFETILQRRDYAALGDSDGARSKRQSAKVVRP